MFLLSGIKQEQDWGAIIIQTYSTADITGCVFAQNQATDNGGAIYVKRSKVQISRSQFEQNSAQDSGGSIVVHTSQGRIQDFSLGGGGGANPRWRGHQPLTQVLFGENICKNERIWSCWGGGRGRAHRKLLYVDPPLLVILISDSVNSRLSQ